MEKMQNQNCHCAVEMTHENEVSLLLFSKLNIIFQISFADYNVLIYSIGVI